MIAEMTSNAVGIDEVVVGVGGDVGVRVGVAGFKADVQGLGVGVVRYCSDVGAVGGVRPVHRASNIAARKRTAPKIDSACIDWHRGNCAPRREESTEGRCRIGVHAKGKVARELGGVKRGIVDVAGMVESFKMVAIWGSVVNFRKTGVGGL